MMIFFADVPQIAQDLEALQDLSRWISLHLAGFSEAQKDHLSAVLVGLVPLNHDRLAAGENSRLPLENRWERR